MPKSVEKLQTSRPRLREYSYHPFSTYSYVCPQQTKSVNLNNEIIFAPSIINVYLYSAFCLRHNSDTSPTAPAKTLTNQYFLEFGPNGAQTAASDVEELLLPGGQPAANTRRRHNTKPFCNSLNTLRTGQCLSFIICTARCCCKTRPELRGFHISRIKSQASFRYFSTRDPHHRHPSRYGKQYPSTKWKHNEDSFYTFVSGNSQRLFFPIVLKFCFTGQGSFASSVE